MSSVAALLWMAGQVLLVPVDTVVVCPSEFLQTLEPWLEYRQDEGHQLSIVTDCARPEEIRAAIRQAATGGNLRFIVLIGDVAPTGTTNRQTLSRSLPTYLAAAEVNVRWGSEKDIATDNWYADLDGDRIPDVAVGRLCVDTPAELKSVINKILDYERSHDVGIWRRKISFVAGASGFGLLTDMVLENATKKILIDRIPASYDTPMLYANWRSPYCPNPVEFEQTVVQRLDAGCFVWVYLGHGHRTQLDHLRTPAGYAPVLRAETVGRLNCPSAGPIAVLLACYSGAFDGSDECLAELMLRAPQGPVAVICGSRVTMPYGMAVLGTELLHEFFTNERPTLGEIMLHGKRRTVSKQRDSQRRRLDSLAKAVSPDSKQMDAECLEHVNLFNLLGDPLLKLRYAQRITLEIPKYVRAGERLEVRGESPVAGKLLLELVSRRDRLTFQPTPRHQFELSNQALQEMNQVSQHANDKRWTFQRHTIGTGEFTLDVKVPTRAQGPCHVRAYVHAENRYALGAVDVYVRRPTTARSVTTTKKR